MYVRGHLRLHYKVILMIDSKSTFHAESKSVGGQKIKSGEIFLQAFLFQYPSTLLASFGPRSSALQQIAGLSLRHHSYRANAFS